MCKDLQDMAKEKGIECEGSWIKMAFNEILGTIYFSEISEDELDKLIEKLASIALKYLDIREDELDWQKIEEYHYKEVYNLISYEDYLDFNEAKKIISKAKVSQDYEWEDIESKAMDISKINKKILENFTEYIEEFTSYDEQTRKEFIEKGIYIDFRDNIRIKDEKKIQSNF